jgi:DNA transformation protein and related proteins
VISLHAVAHYEYNSCPRYVSLAQSSIFLKITMPKSPAFARLQRDILRLCAVIPAGRVCTYADLGAVIEVPARHVAYIVSRLDDATRAQYPVHRLVGAGGKLPAQPATVVQQIIDEGLVVRKGVVVDWTTTLFVPNASTVQGTKLERTTRPPEHARSVDGGAALSELRGLGPASVQMLTSVGITSAAQLRKADLFKLYARIKQTHPRASINLVYAMIGAVQDMDWHTVAKDRRTEGLLRLDDMKLL